jgi:hypothetical protein
MFSFLRLPRHRPIRIMEPDGRLTSHCTHRHPCWLVQLRSAGHLWRQAQMRLWEWIRQKAEPR